MWKVLSGVMTNWSTQRTLGTANCHKWQDLYLHRVPESRSRTACYLPFVQGQDSWIDSRKLYLKCIQTRSNLFRGLDMSGIIQPMNWMYISTNGIPEWEDKGDSISIQWKHYLAPFSNRSDVVGTVARLSRGQKQPLTELSHLIELKDAYRKGRLDWSFQQMNSSMKQDICLGLHSTRLESMPNCGERS